MPQVETKRVPQINLKILGYNAKELRKMVDGVKEQVFLAQVGGVVAEVFVGTSKHGEWTGLRGLFAMRDKDGQTYHSTTAFLPTNIVKKITDRMAQGEVEIEFAAEIFVVESEKNASGYAYICEPIMSELAAKKAEAITQRLLIAPLPKQQAKLAAPAKKSA